MNTLFAQSRVVRARGVNGWWSGNEGDKFKNISSEINQTGPGGGCDADDGAGDADGGAGDGGGASGCGGGAGGAGGNGDYVAAAAVAAAAATAAVAAAAAAADNDDEVICHNDSILHSNILISVTNLQSVLYPSMGQETWMVLWPH